jgi:hypothetical protein
MGEYAEKVHIRDNYEYNQKVAMRALGIDKVLAEDCIYDTVDDYINDV